MSLRIVYASLLTLQWSFLVSLCLTKQGKNVKVETFDAIGDTLKDLKWELPQCEEYKGDFPQPAFAPMCPMIVGSNAPPQMALGNAPSPQQAPLNDQQWEKVNSMVVMSSEISNVYCVFS